jgi:uncharacterized OB-fold protein
MSIAVFFVLALLAAAFIAYPLLPGRVREGAFAAVTDQEIEQAVRQLRPVSNDQGDSCPTCGSIFTPGDRFCVSCGGELPVKESSGRVCPSCGAVLGAGDQFCAKCGHKLLVGEVA